MTRLLLIRHAESEWNAQGRWQGHADPPLSVRGREQAAAAAASLEGLVSRAVASDLLRARETAQILSESLGLGEVAVEPLVREIGVGDWTGLTRDEIDERWPGLRQAWRDGNAAIPGGEDREAFRNRVLKGLEAAAGGGGGPVLVVTHSAAIGVVERHLGVHPGHPIARLAGRWFEFDGELRAASGRLQFS